MFDKLRKIKTILMLVLDSVCICIGYYVALLLRLDCLPSTLRLTPNYPVVMRYLPIIIIIHMLVFIAFKINKTLWRYFSIDEVVRVVIAVCLSNFIWFFYIYQIHTIPSFPRTVPVIATLIIIMEMLAIRVTYRLYRKYVHRIRQDSRSIIIGAGDAGSILAREITYTERYNTKIVGFIDENQVKKDKIILGYPVLGNDQDIPNVVKKHKVDTAYVALPNSSNANIKRIIRLCNECGLVVKVMNYHDDNATNKIDIRNASLEDLLGRSEIHLNTYEIGGYLENKVVFVSGAGGSIGSELCRQIINYHPKKLIMFDIYENNLYGVQQEFEILKRNGHLNTNAECYYLIGSVRDTHRLDEIFIEYHPDVVFHAAAHKHVPLMEVSVKEAVKNNVFGTLNMVNTCIAHKVERMILISTDKAVNPTSVMGATKRICEMIIQAYGNNGVTKLSAVRFGNVLGSNGSVVPLFQKQIQEGGPVTVTDKNVVRYFMTISEAVQLVLQAGAFADDGSIYVLDMGEPMKIVKLAEDMIKLAGYKPYEDIQIIFTGLRPGEKMYEELNLIQEDFKKTSNPLIYKATPLDFTIPSLQEHLMYLKLLIDRDAPNLEVAEYVLKETNKKEMIQG